MNKQESYKTYMILMICSYGRQNNVFSISTLIPIVVLSGFRGAAIALPSHSLTVTDLSTFLTLKPGSIVSIPFSILSSPINSFCPAEKFSSKKPFVFFFCFSDL